MAWEVGGHTRAGRSKTALSWDNEDQVLTKLFPDEEGALVAVADGVSTCNVGSGPDYPNGTSLSRRGATRSQLPESAHAPWTRTTVGLGPCL